MMMQSASHPPMRYCARCERVVATAIYCEIADRQGVIFSGCATCLRTIHAGVIPEVPPRPVSDATLVSLLLRAEAALTTPQHYLAIDALVVELQEAQLLLTARRKD